MLLEEDNYDYNESNRKRVMTAYQVMKSLTGEMVSNPDLLSQAKFYGRVLLYLTRIVTAPS